MLCHCHVLFLLSFLFCGSGGQCDVPKEKHMQLHIPTGPVHSVKSRAFMGNLYPFECIALASTFFEICEYETSF
jgi:hypothetical protein